jgi:hypothetical protein
MFISEFLLPPPSSRGWELCRTMVRDVLLAFMVEPQWVKFHHLHDFKALFGKGTEKR